MKIPPKILSITLPLLLVLALTLRLYGLHWDQGYHLHPDERFMTMVATSIQWPSSVSEYFSVTSPLSPYNTDHKSYIYGTFPLYLTTLVADLQGKGFYGQLHYVGRTLSTLFDVGTILVLFMIGRKIKNATVGLISASLYTVTLLAVQQSHFFTVDNFLTFWLVLTFYCLVEFLYSNKKLLWSIALGITFGGAIASKISGLLFGSVIGLGFLAAWIYTVHQIEPSDKNLKPWFVKTLQFIGLGLVTLIVTYGTFRTMQPSLFATSNWLNLTVNPHFQQAFSFQSAAIKGEIMFPPQYQWVDTVKYWFPLRNLVIWGVGIPLGVTFIASVAASVWIGVQWLKSHTPEKETTLAGVATLLLWIWCVGLFIYQGGNFVKTMRYFLPLLPFLTLLAGIAIYSLQAISKKIAYGTWLGVFFASLVWVIMYLHIYSTDSTRIAASTWMYDNIPETATVANEHWDDPLPLLLPNRPYTIAGQELEVYANDTQEQSTQEEKLQQLYAVLEGTDYVILSSPRAKSTIGQLRDEFPIMYQYYQLLESGALGYQLVHRETSYPRLFGYTIPDESAEEAFWVYDHPPVEIYEKQQTLTYTEFRSKFIL